MNMQRLIRRWIVCTAMVFVITGELPLTAHAALPDTVITGMAFGPTMTGWLEAEDGSWRYMENGAPLSGRWEEIGGHWYLFDENGVMLTGWQAVGEERFYLAEHTDETHPKGACYLSERTPDGSLVNERGAFVVEKHETAQAINRPNPYGHSCVEIDISDQMMYCYIGEQLVIASPCVTGVPYNHSTTEGVHHIYSKETGRYLQGYNDNGTRYKSWVNYWMPFCGGEGLHDATWRSNFGENIYRTNGSHGCVNLPRDVAAALYNVSWVGMPVIVHS